METDEKVLRAIVEQAGAEWCGIQWPLFIDDPTLVLFNHPVTHSTLALPIEQMSVICVRQRLQEHHDKFQDALNDLKLAVKKLERLNRGDT